MDPTYLTTTAQVDQSVPCLSAEESELPVLICLLGTFQVLKRGQPISVRGNGKAETLLRFLAFPGHHTIARETLLEKLWPNTDMSLASQSLNSLMYSLRKAFRDELNGAPPVLCMDGYYRLNVEAGISVDAVCFDALMDAGDQQTRKGNKAEAINCYSRALLLYRGELCSGEDISEVVERERLRARYLTLLTYLADYYYHQADYSTCLHFARRLLLNDPCREDAHRLVMRCHMWRGERAQALRQYRLCQDLLQAEFGAVPEPATTALFDQIRLDPGSICSTGVRLLRDGRSTLGSPEISAKLQ